MLILGLVYLPGWVVGTVSFLVFFYIYTRWKQSYFQRHGIPFKQPTFFIGDMDPGIKGGDYIDNTVVDEYGKVFGTYGFNTPVLNIADADIVKQITVKDFANFTDRPRAAAVSLMSAVSVADGDHWRFLRSTLTPTFTSGKLRAMKPYIQRCIDILHELLEDEMEKHPEGFNISPFFDDYAMDLICNVGFSLETSAQRQPDHILVKNARMMFSDKRYTSLQFMIQLMIPELGDSWLMRKVASLTGPDEGTKVITDMLKEVIKERKLNPSEHKDSLQNMINAQKEIGSADKKEHQCSTLNDFKKRGFTDEEILTNSIIFMLGGFETTSTTLSWLAYDLATNPEVQEKLIQEIDKDIGKENVTYDNVLKLKYMDMVVKETLRIHPTVIGTSRKAKEDTEINGVFIPKDVMLIIRTTALHRMPEYWEDPHCYNPDRFSEENEANINQYAYQPFGLGPRNCIAMRLALLEVKSTFVSLLQKYRICKTDSLKIPMKAKGISILRPESPVHVRLEKRHIHAGSKDVK